MDIYMNMNLYFGLFYFVSTLVCIQGDFTYRYLGCFIDSSFIKTFPSYSIWVADNSIENCVALCHARGYRYAGLQDGSCCSCGNSGYDRYGKGYWCSYPCPGNRNQKCGGWYQNSVYEIVRFTTHHPVETTTVSPMTPPAVTSSPKEVTSEPKEMENEGVEDSSSLSKNTGVYIGSVVAAVAVCAITVLIVCRKQKAQTLRNREEIQSLDSVSLSSHPSSSRSDCHNSDSTLGAAAATRHVAVTGDVYALVNKAPADTGAPEYLVANEERGDNTPAAYHTNQSTDSYRVDHQIYSLAEPTIDDLVVVDNQLYGS